MAEETLSAASVYKGRILELKVFDVKLPNGREARREIVEHPGAVAMVPLLDGGRVALVMQFRLAAGRELLEIPAGTLRRGEDPVECAKRELIEETGYEAGSLEPLAEFFLAPGYSTELMRLYLARDLRRIGQRPDVDEQIRVVEMDVADAWGLVERGGIRDAKTIVGLALALQRLGGPMASGMRSSH
ncbi:MAG: NUDIX hydrolase [Candidatus Bathyarchaeia archaeon]